MLEMQNKKFKFIKPVMLLNYTNTPKTNNDKNPTVDNNFIKTQKFNLFTPANKNSNEELYPNSPNNIHKNYPNINKKEENNFSKNFNNNNDSESITKLKNSKSTKTNLRISSPIASHSKNINYPEILKTSQNKNSKNLTASKADNINPSKIVKNLINILNSNSNNSEKLINIKKMENQKKTKTIRESKNNNNEIDKNTQEIQLNNKIGLSNSFIHEKILNTKYKNYENAKYSEKSNGVIEGYGANTYQGIVRNYNEDRVTIILNVIQPNSRKEEIWPKVSFFGIYDGHGGNKCADYLKENLHQFIFREKCFPNDPIKAIHRGFEEVEKSFVLKNKPMNLINDFDKSGSCAIIIIIMDDICYVANLGDSRALISENGSNRIYQISKDHKPNDFDENKRVEAAGGYIYQGQVPSNLTIQNMNIPWRIFPGRLSVSRSFGDIEAKIPELGGNPRVLIAEPTITSFRITDESDFIILGSDGVFDKYSNLDIIKSIWATTYKNLRTENINKQCGRIVDLVLKTSMNKNTMDNITSIFISFQNFKNILFNKEKDSLESNLHFIHSNISKTYSYKLDEKINYNKVTGTSKIHFNDDMQIDIMTDNFNNKNIENNSDSYDFNIYRISQPRTSKNSTNNIFINTLNNLPKFKSDSHFENKNNFGNMKSKHNSDFNYNSLSSNNYNISKSNEIIFTPQNKSSSNFGNTMTGNKFKYKK